MLICYMNFLESKEFLDGNPYTFQAIPSVPLTNSQPVTMATKVDSNVSDTRAGRFKIKKRIIVGNVSK